SARVRRGARLAWGAVAMMGAAVCGAVGWTTHRVTQADLQIRELQMYADRTQEAARALSGERDAARQDATAARLASAESAGRLAAYVEQAKLQARHTALVSGDRPTSQPAGLMQRLAAVIDGD